jgi:hypothetical protein
VRFEITQEQGRNGQLIEMWMSLSWRGYFVFSNGNYGNNIRQPPTHANNIMGIIYKSIYYRLVK